MGRVFFAVIIVGGLMLSSICLGYSGGSGTAEEPYQIATKTDLLALAGTTADYNKCFILTADINMGGQVFTTAIIAADTNSKSGFQGTAFKGTFDGNVHKITHFTINGGSNYYLGLFGLISNGSVKNLGLEDFAVSGDANYVGGLVGSNGGSLTSCYATGSVTGEDYVGGLVGSNIVGTLTSCCSTGSVTGNSSVGGLVGLNHAAISICWTSLRVTSCYATGSVTGTDRVGGLVGSNICENWATLTLTACFWDINTSGQTVGVGYGTSTGVTGKTTAEMKMLTTFTSADWNFVDIWNIGENQTYPFLRKYFTGDLNYDGSVDFVDFAIFAQHWLEGL